MDACVTSTHHSVFQDDSTPTVFDLETSQGLKRRSDPAVEPRLKPPLHFHSAALCQLSTASGSEISLQASPLKNAKYTLNFLGGKCATAVSSHCSPRHQQQHGGDLEFNFWILGHLREMEVISPAIYPSWHVLRLKCKMCILNVGMVWNIKHSKKKLGRERVVQVWKKMMQESNLLKANQVKWINQSSQGWRGFKPWTSTQDSKSFLFLSTFQALPINQAQVIDPR